MSLLSRFSKAKAQAEPTRVRPHPQLAGLHSRLLNLGCGNRFHADWVNVDIAPSDPAVLAHDLRLPLPFADGWFEVVYHSHVLEHLPREQALPFLRECHRVLAPGGVLRVVVPDLEQLVTVYLEKLRGALAGDARSQEHYEWMVVELLDQLVRQHADGGEMFRYLCRDPIPALDFAVQRLGHELTSKLENIQGYVKLGVTSEVIDRQRANFTPAEVGTFRTSGEVHLWMYDRYSLGQLLGAAGFQEIQVAQARTSRVVNFAKYALDVLADGTVRKPDSLFMEARK